MRLANLAVAVEQGARFDHQFGDGDIALDPAAGDDFQPSGIDIAFEAAADEDVLGLELTFEMAFLSDGHLRLGLNVSLDSAVDVQVVAQGEVADKL